MRKLWRGLEGKGWMCFMRYVSRSKSPLASFLCSSLPFGPRIQGDIAASLVQTVSSAGGILTLEDFASYKPIIVPALQATYRNRTYYTGHYPSGGPILVSLLNTLEGYEDYVDEGRTGLATHRFVEALKCEFFFVFSFEQLFFRSRLLMLNDLSFAKRPSRFRRSNRSRRSILYRQCCQTRRNSYKSLRR